MTKRKSTKRALLLSALSLLMCVSMLIGSTFAWFTDSVTSGKNTIQAGNLDVELYYTYDADVAADKDSKDWVKVTKDTDVFGYNLWEPGYTKVAYFKVVNEGSLELKYQLAADVYEEKAGKNQAGAEFLLSDYIKTALVNVGATRNEILAMEGTPLKNSYDMSKGSLAAKETAIVGLAIWMPTTVGNVANHDGKTIPEITFGINLLATQKDKESDSFGSDYDKNAWVDGMKVYTAQDLQAALANGKNAVLQNDIPLTETVQIPEGATVVLDMNGYDLSGSAKNLIYSQGNLTITGEGEITSTLNGPSYAIRAQKGTLLVDGNITVNSEFGCVEIYNGAEVTINNGSYYAKGINGKTSHTVFVKNSKLTVNGGTFDSGYSSEGIDTICGNGTATIALKGGNFYASELGESFFLKGNVVVTGGAYQYNPGSRIATGYKAVENNGVYYVVPDGVSNVVTTAAQLQDALNAATGDATIVLAADITGDVTVKQKEGVNIVVDGKNYKYDGTIYIDGSNRYTGEETVKLQNINFETAKPANTGIMDFISANVASQYTHNVTIEDCTFTNKGEGTVVPARFRQAYDITMKNCTIEGTFSPLWATGVKGLTIDNVIANCKDEGITVGASDNVLIENCTITVPGANGFAIRTDATAGYKMTVNNCKLNAAKAIVIRGSSDTYTVTVDGVPVVGTNNGLKSAIDSGAKEILLPSGTYELDTAMCGVTIKGVDEKTTLLEANVPIYGFTGAIYQRMHFENLTFTNTISTFQDTATEETGGGSSTFTNVTFAAGFRHGYGSSVVFTDCTFGSNHENYALHFEGDPAGTEGEIKLSGCKFEGGNVHLGGPRTYAFTNCEFDAGTDFQVWSGVTLDGCTVGGVEVTEANIATLFPNLDLTLVTIK